ncbi:ATP-binding cassette domain-containing protein [Pediococcus ethanolidurans]|uniref:ABC transporter ATP-binding protein n=1 Tax=Pediococcus ethanolidurans TaxID=319653 RepID=UPI002955C41E|nr:ABC transporter ATP-binding protein [Pediococcus ethanolidurans]MDV7719617.1 ATP-binding cassette domain-containing protein [Pediococcus ethanolidurans]
MGEELLTIDHLHTSFKRGTKYYDAVDDVSLKIHKDEILAIVGESGCGKTTLAKSIIGLHDLKRTKISGHIGFENQELVGASPEKFDKLRGSEMGMIFQDPLAALNPLMRIEDQIQEVLDYHTDYSKSKKHKIVLELLDQVGLENPERVARQFPHELSGGMRQRIIIAIAIACKPELIIADEPTTALDVTIQAQILDLLRNIQAQNHAGIILITHDLGVVADTADEVVVMYAGQVVERGSVSQIFNHPLHPYTRSLLKSIPQADRAGDRLYAIEGSVPPLTKMPHDGCRFAPRIPWVPESAHEKKPTMHEPEKGHFVLCTCYQTFEFENGEAV